MTMDASNLKGEELDAEVAKAEGVDVFYSNIHDIHFLTERYDSGTEFQADAVYSPSTRWQDGGSIIEREGISVGPGWAGGRVVWYAHMGGRGDDFAGDTALIAAMRAYVASKEQAP